MIKAARLRRGLRHRYASSAIAGAIATTSVAMGGAAATAVGTAADIAAVIAAAGTNQTLSWTGWAASDMGPLFLLKDGAHEG